MSNFYPPNPLKGAHIEISPRVVLRSYFEEVITGEEWILQLLQTFKNIVDASPEKVYNLNSEQEKAIDSAREQIKKGNFNDNERLVREMKEWLVKE